MTEKRIGIILHGGRGNCAVAAPLRAGPGHPVRASQGNAVMTEKRIGIIMHGRRRNCAVAAPLRVARPVTPCAHHRGTLS